MEMLKQWQMLYGQSQKQSVPPKFRHKQRFEAQLHSLNSRINSLDCASSHPYNLQNNETLMQNIKISQLNQISAVLDQQTEKLIAHT